MNPIIKPNMNNINPHSPHIITSDSQKPLPGHSNTPLKFKNIIDLTSSHLSQEIPNVIPTKPLSKTLTLEDIIKSKDKHIEKLEHLNSYLTAGLKKRDDLAKSYFDENTKLKEILKNKNMLIERLKEDLNLTKQYIKISNRLANKQNQVGKIVNVPKIDTSMIKSSEIKMNSPPLIRAVSSHTTRHSSRRHSSRNLTIMSKAVTVTETQGIKDFQKLFLGHSGRVSILQMNEYEILKSMNSTKMKELQNLLENKEEFIEEFKGNRNIEAFNTIKQIFNDLRALFRVILSLKKLLAIIIQLNNVTTINNIFQMINEDLIDLFRVEKAILYLKDDKSKELYTKIPNNDDEEIMRFPINQGIIGHVALSGKTIHIDDAAIDPRFKADIDEKHGIKIKNLLCAPIKDSFDTTIGVIEIMNKNGILTADDDEIMHILTKNIAIILKNIFNYERIFHNYHRISRLFQVTSDLSISSNIPTLITETEKIIKELLLSDHCTILMNDLNTKTLYKYDQQKNHKISFELDSGIASLSAQQGQFLYVQDPQKHPYYNPAIDIDTQLPIMCIPIRVPKDDNPIIGIIEITTPKLSTKAAIEGQAYDNEMIGMLSYQFCINLERLMRQINDICDH